MGNAASMELPMSQTDFESFRGPRYTQAAPGSGDASHGPAYFADHREVDESAQTLYLNFLRGWSLEEGARPCYGVRQVDPATGKVGAFAWLTYDHVKRRAAAIASGLARLTGLKRQDRVGVFSKNRLEWCLAMHASDRMAYALVPLYDTLGPDAVPFIVNHTELTVLLCAREQFHVVMDCAASCPTLKYVVQFEPVTSEQRHAALQRNIVLKSLGDVELVGRAEPVPADPPLPSDVSTLCYTSGTTGDPKGVILTHRNLSIAAALGTWRLEVSSDDVHLSYLPLAHVFERIVNTVFLRSGAAVGFYQGDVLFLMEDMAALRPTVFVSVPRLFNRVFDKISQGVAAAGGVKKLLFDQAYAAKKSGTVVHKSHAFWDALVFTKMRAVLGGRVRIIFSGSAPLSADVKEFMRIVFCCDVLEGYGLTETAAVVAIATGEMPMGAHVGPPADNLLVRLEDVPEMNYTSKDKPRPRGEILVKGPTIFSGYYKEDDKTKEALDADGWFHTGDIGCWNADGTLSIIDRKKNIFKLSQGEYVAAEKVEGVYLKSKYVAQIFVYGDSLQNSLVAIVVPDPEVAEAWGAEHGLAREHATAAQLAAHNDAFKKDVLEDMARTARAAELRGFEQVKQVHFHPDAFTMEAGLITPTFKLKRPQLKEFFQVQINHMYEGLK